MSIAVASVLTPPPRLGSWPFFVVTLGATTAVLILGLFVGAAELSPASVLAALSDGVGLTEDASEAWTRTIVLELRLPRLGMGLLVGGALALSGALMQGLFRNPLADPTLIGVSSGAALGAASAIVVGRRVEAVSAFLGSATIPLAAFLAGLATTAFVYRLSVRQGRTAVPTMLLAGIAINALAFSGTGLLIFVADDAELRDITFWTLGSVAGASWERIGILGAMVTVAGALALRTRHELDLMALGDVEAEHLGVETDVLRRRIVVCVAAMVGCAVAVAGQIAFVGLVVPHALRLLYGPSHKSLLPLAALAGGLVLAGADVFARTIVAPVELPIGIMTALLGAPFFLVLLRRGAA